MQESCRYILAHYDVDYSGLGLSVVDGWFKPDQILVKQDLTHTEHHFRAACLKISAWDNVESSTELCMDN
jgi:hypothetical protein